MTFQNSSIKLILLLLLITNQLLGQYWQQYVEYDMQVELNAEEKTLTATSNLLYVNHSPDTLDHIFMHLYHNAFNEGTIAQQVWEDYGHSLDMEKGWTGIQIEQALADSNKLEFLIRDDTILDITLNGDLNPGDSLHFSLEWISIIHPHLDRSGWEGEQFDFAQWYPKFVVYDETGWHDDPFGDWGEFYGEFGDFTVHLDIPASQIVGATGIVIEGDPGWTEVTVDTSKPWIDWVESFREDRGKRLKDLDSTARREVTFFAENVHDFAWTCSPDFVYEHGTWNGIDVHTLFTSLVGEDWTKDVVEDGLSAIRWLSEKFGPYPWPQMTITKALLGGGMEYPMLIMDASDSESLIVHEIGHNWFYGLFGNDELDDAWLDEGFTTFQTRWYIEQYYPENGYDISRNNITCFESECLPRQMYLEDDLKPVIRYLLSPCNEPIATHSFDFTNYGSYRTNVYTKASLMLHSLKEYLGEDRFLAGMQVYYDRWALKHVNEDRFIKAMEDGSGEELDWFFDQWLHATNYVDYKLSKVNTESLDQGIFKTSIQVENLGRMFVPISATVFGENGETATASLKEFKYRQNGIIDLESNFKPIDVEIDADNIFLDVDRRNNGSKKKPDWRYNYLGWTEYPDNRNLYLWKPQFGFNDVDGLGLGLGVERVYRNPGDFIALELDQNLASQKLYYAISFSRQQVGLPLQATWKGRAGHWQSINYASLEYELNWAKIFWKNPVHYLTIKADHTGLVDFGHFTRLGLCYELQHELFHGDYGLSANYNFSPSALGDYVSDFNQLSLVSNWARSFSYIKINNRSNLLANSEETPDLVTSNIATQDKRSILLNRGASSWHHTNEIDMLGPRYYLAGGGRLRGYTDSLGVSANYLWSNNLDLTITSGPFSIDKIELGVFLDFGQISEDTKEWTWAGDAGLGFKYKPSWKRNNWLSTILRPVQLKVEFPVVRYEDDGLVNTFSRKLWIFSISN